MLNSSSAFCIVFCFHHAGSHFHTLPNWLLYIISFSSIGLPIIGLLPSATALAYSLCRH